MCRAVKFRFDGKDWQVRFAQNNARLPVFIPKTKETILMSWGRRPREQSGLPFGGWARRTNIHSGKWDQFTPKSARIPLDYFMETDVAGNQHWFEVTRGNFVQGLVATLGKERRIYVVTIDPPPEDVHFEQWPRVINTFK